MQTPPQLQVPSGSECMDWIQGLQGPQLIKKAAIFSEFWLTQRLVEGGDVEDTPAIPSEAQTPSWKGGVSSAVFRAWHGCGTCDLAAIVLVGIRPTPD